MEHIIEPRQRLEAAPDILDENDVVAAAEVAAEAAAAAAEAEATSSIDLTMNDVAEANLLRTLSFASSGLGSSEGNAIEEMQSRQLENRINSRSFLYEFNKEGGSRLHSAAALSSDNLSTSSCSPSKKLTRMTSQDLEDLGVEFVEASDEEDENDTGEEVLSPASPDISRLKRHESWLLSLGECKFLLIEE